MFHSAKVQKMLYKSVEQWLAKSGLFDRIAVRFPQLLRSSKQLYGLEQGGTFALRWLARLLILEIGLAATGMIAVALLANFESFCIFLMFTLVFPLAMWRDLTRQAAKRRQAIVFELPGFVHRMSLLLSAGETVQQAWVRASSSPHMQQHPLYIELTKTNNELMQSIPFATALENLHRRCGQHELSSVVLTVLMNYRRGGDAFALALQAASRSLTERQVAMTRTKGEEASTKLIFPMIIMLGAIMAVIAAPAVMMMN